LNIPESCKWDSKKRNRKTVEQKNNNQEEETEEVEDETTDRDFGFLSQANHKRAPLTQEKNIQNRQVVEELPGDQELNKTNFDYSLKKLKTAISSSNECLTENNRVEIKPIPLIKSAKSIDLLYTNKLLEIKQRIWAEDLTKEEFEKIIQDFETFRRTHQPDILSKQSKDKLKDTEARIAYLIDKWDIDMNCMLTLKNQN
jgi:hypothetical protein